MKFSKITLGGKPPASQGTVTPPELRRDVTNSHETVLTQADLPERKKRARERKIVTATPPPALVPKEPEDADLSVPPTPKISVPVVSGLICAVCKAPYREELEQAHLRGFDIAKIAAHYGLSQHEVRQHLNHRAASAKFEATVDGISNEIELWRVRTHGLYSRLENMLSLIENGLIERITPRGEVILNPTTIGDIKPVIDSLVKCVGSASSLIDQFAKVHRIYAADTQSGPAIHFTIVNAAQTEPVIIDRKYEPEMQSAGSMRIFDGKTEKHDKLDDSTLELVKHYLATGTTDLPEANGGVTVIDSSHLTPL